MLGIQKILRTCCAPLVWDDPHISGYLYVKLLVPEASPRFLFCVPRVLVFLPPSLVCKRCMHAWRYRRSLLLSTPFDAVVTDSFLTEEQVVKRLRSKEGIELKATWTLTA